jgi:hypothetical protein
MAEVMPINIPLPSESAIASYSYSDLAGQTGVQLFYGATVMTSAATTNILTPNMVYSKVIEQGGDNAIHADYTKVSDLDFDLTAFNNPHAIRGTALFSFFQKAYSGGQVWAYSIVKIRKWDGATETDIASAQTEDLTNIDGTHRYNFVLLPVVIPKTHFKIGEVLRVTVEQYLKSPTNVGTVKIGTDPMNRDGAVEYIVPSTDADPVSTTQFKCWIPFHLDL